MSADRWQRLVDDLAAAGVTARVEEKSYVEQRHYRTHFGVSRSVRLILDDGRHVVVMDKQWRKNPDVWVGWQVAAEGADALVDRIYPLTKKRSEVVAAVLDAMCGVAVKG